MQDKFYTVLLASGFNSEEALTCARVFMTNSMEGVNSHGVNRFLKFIADVREKKVLPGVAPTLENRFGALEQWNGNLGAGILNAVWATERAIILAREYGIACIGLANTNHWMRGGFYGWQAAGKGCVFIGWTNTIANMPAWNALDNKLGNNPLVIALPFGTEAIVLDMAMSQFSYGRLESEVLNHTDLPVSGGFTKDGLLTCKPAEILESKRILPAGFWKGAGMALLLDILATIISSGNSTSQITLQGAEYAVSQVFVCIDLSRLKNNSLIQKAVTDIIQNYLSSETVQHKGRVVYPGQKVAETRKENLHDGIPVSPGVWNEILNFDI